MSAANESANASTARRPHVIVVPGDDAAPDAVLATMNVLDMMRLAIDFEVLEPGTSLPYDLADRADTVLFGSSNGTSRGLEHLRYGWGTYANVRPVKWREGVPAAIRQPEGVDYVIVREALEDVYVGIEGSLDDLRASGLPLRTPYERRGTRRFRFDGEGRFGVKIYTREVVQRVAAFAGGFAQRRKGAGHEGRVSVGGKWNVNPVTDRFFRDVALETLSTIDGIVVDTFLADDLGRRLVASPQHFDVVLLPNLYGDVLSDVGLGAVGGLGMGPSGGFGDDRAYFEPVHGTAPDLVGLRQINPAATILSAVMMLDYLGFADECRRLERALDATLARGEAVTPDLGGKADTFAMAAAVATAYAG